MTEGRIASGDEMAVVAKWTHEHPKIWGDPLLQALAIGLHNYHLQYQPQMSLLESLANIERILMERWPEKFNERFH